MPRISWIQVLRQAQFLTRSAISQVSLAWHPPLHKFDFLKESTSPLHKKIDHTFLKPEATEQDIQKLCNEAKQYDFYSVCVSPKFVKFAKKLLEKSTVKVITVVGFPTGLSSTLEKVQETQTALLNGAQEIDMVIHTEALKNKEYDYVLKDIQNVVFTAHPIPVKVILETCLLNEDEKKIASALVLAAGAHYVKTSTGFSKGGATVADMILIKKIVGDKCGIKASGGVKTFAQAEELIHAGATRIGSSSGAALLNNNVHEKSNELY